jgi:branched-chain amino acid transport system permease protein
VAGFGKWRRLWTSYLGLAVTALVWLAGASAMVEMIYHLQLDAGSGDEVRFLGGTLNIRSNNTWLVSAALFVVGYALFELVRRRFKLQWGTIQEEIEKELQRRGHV